MRLHITQNSYFQFSGCSVWRPGLARGGGASDLLRNIWTAKRIVLCMANFSFSINDLVICFKTWRRNIARLDHQMPYASVKMYPPSRWWLKSNIVSNSLLAVHCLHMCAMTSQWTADWNNWQNNKILGKSLFVTNKWVRWKYESICITKINLSKWLMCKRPLM